jgi:hypothetical protein
MAKIEKKTKLPKKLGGVKLPKQLRKSAEVMAEIAQNQVAREVVSAALVAGAAALARRKVKDKRAAAPASDAKKPGTEFDALIAQGKDVGNMIALGVNAFVSALLKPIEKKAAPAAAPDTLKPAASKPEAVKPAVRRTAAKPATVKPPAARRTTAKPATTTTAPAKPRGKPGPKPKTPS